MYAASDVVTAKDFYAKYLACIAGINFTQREIDAISCIVSGRSVKGTALLLSQRAKEIAPRSVEAHLLNVRRKIGGSAKDNIINFVESSDKYQAVQGYYKILLIDTEFLRTLDNIKNRINTDCQTVQLLYSEQTGHSQALLSRLTVDLRYLGIETTEEQLQDIAQPLMSKNKNIIYITPSLVNPTYRALIEQRLCANVKNARSIILLSNQNQIELTEVADDEQDTHRIINLSTSTYYAVFLDIVSVFLPEVATYASEAKDMISHKYGLVINYTPTTKDVKSAQHFFGAVIAILQKEQKYVLAIVSVLLLFLIFYWDNSMLLQKQDGLDYDTIISKINHTTQQSNKTCTTNNVTAKTLAANHAAIKELESVWRDIQSENIAKYYTHPEVDTLALSNLAYSLCVLANYYNIHEHDGLKARAILQKSKIFLEQYVIQRSKIKFDLDSLEPEEIYIEIKDFAHIREMYTLVHYLLGRTYTYQGDKEDGVKHFQISRLLGDKFNLFEGYLSRINLLKVRKNNIASLIKDNNGKYEAINHLCNSAIEEYKLMMKDHRSYKDSYRPGGELYNLVVPADSPYNKLECIQEIISYYIILMLVENNRAKLEDYLLEATTALCLNQNADEQLIGLLKQVEYKKIANILCTTGYLVLLSYDKDIKFSNHSNGYEALIAITEQFNDFINKEDILIDDKDLNVAHKVFVLADMISKHSHYTKAEANNGLRLIYERLLKLEISASIRQTLQDKIERSRSVRDGINEHLKRTGADPINFIVR